MLTLFFFISRLPCTYFFSFCNLCSHYIHYIRIGGGGEDLKVKFQIKINFEYACAEGGAHFPIAHALRLPEPTKNTKSEGCVPPIRSGPLAALRFVSTQKEREKKEKICVRTICVRMHYVRTNEETSSNLGPNI